MKTALRWILLFLGAAISFHALFFMAGFYFIYPLSFMNPSVTSLMLFRSISSDRQNQEILFTPLSEIPKKIQLMTVEVEDENFYRHWGFDPIAIKYAIKTNIKMGYIALGGSTITQQLSRTLFLFPQKNYYRKYVEILTAVLMEKILSKDRILELYLNYVEWGKGIYGLGRAALHYYGKKPSQLSNDESARLLSILPNPLLYHPGNFRSNIFLNRRYNILLNFLK